MPINRSTLSPFLTWLLADREYGMELRGLPSPADKAHVCAIVRDASVKYARAVRSVPALHSQDLTDATNVLHRGIHKIGEGPANIEMLLGEAQTQDPRHPMRTIVEGIGRPEVAQPMMQEANTYESTNPGYGFSGTLDLDGLRAAAFDIAARLVQDSLGTTPEKAVWLLDSKWGRHFCDAVNSHHSMRSAAWWENTNHLWTAVKDTIGNRNWQMSANKALIEYNPDDKNHW